MVNERIVDSGDIGNKSKDNSQILEHCRAALAALLIAINPIGSANAFEAIGRDGTVVFSSKLEPQPVRQTQVANPREFTISPERRAEIDAILAKPLENCRTLPTPLDRVRCSGRNLQLEASKDFAETELLKLGLVEMEKTRNKQIQEIAQLELEIAQLDQRNAQLDQEIIQLDQRNVQLDQEIAELGQEMKHLKNIERIGGIPSERLTQQDIMDLIVAARFLVKKKPDFVNKTIIEKLETVMQFGRSGISNNAIIKMAMDNGLNINYDPTKKEISIASLR